MCRSSRYAEVVDIQKLYVVCFVGHSGTNVNCIEGNG